MSPDKLAYMANQIASFFKSRPHAEAVAGIADHISNFWEPRMRVQFFQLLENEAERFDPLVQEAGKYVRPVTANA
ncbi:MAG: formate dehydrogenase subunit delta [Salaquimonas sp.]|jgi:formate dehydrogenase subunit delta|nr:formate dehydrogenase subunit delta [Salaquimonas sp.]